MQKIMSLRLIAAGSCGFFRVVLLLQNSFLIHAASAEKDHCPSHQSRCSPPLANRCEPDAHAHYWYVIFLALSLFNYLPATSTS